MLINRRIPSSGNARDRATICAHRNGLRADCERCAEVAREVEAEREACAEIALTQQANYEISEESQRLLAKVAMRIRKRGTE